MKKHWEIFEAHEKAVLAVHRDLGHVDGKGRVHVRRFDGTKFWPALIARGHNASVFTSCKCKPYGWKFHKLACDAQGVGSCGC